MPLGQVAIHLSCPYPSRPTSINWIKRKTWPCIVSNFTYPPPPLPIWTGGRGPQTFETGFKIPWLKSSDSGRTRSGFRKSFIIQSCWDMCRYVGWNIWDINPALVFLQSNKSKEYYESGGKGKEKVARNKWLGSFPIVRVMRKQLFLIYDCTKKTKFKSTEKNIFSLEINSLLIFGI